MKTLALLVLAALAMAGTGCTECNKGAEHAWCVALGEQASSDVGNSDTGNDTGADARLEDGTPPRDDVGNGDGDAAEITPDGHPGSDAHVTPTDSGAGGSDGVVPPPNDMGTPTDSLPPRDGLPPTDGHIPVDGPAPQDAGPDGLPPTDGLPPQDAAPDGFIPPIGDAAPPPPDGLPPADMFVPPSPDAFVPPPDGAPLCTPTNGGVELCDGLDNDCDDLTDEDGVCIITPPDAGSDAASDATFDAGIPDAATLDGSVSDATAPDADPACTRTNDTDPTCDGVDDDCDGQTDEDYNPSPITCGAGNCASTGEIRCEGGRTTNTCRADNPAPEVCDGQDNNCDGQVDDSANVVCACPDRPGVPYMQECVAGVLQPCPCLEAEICDGLDNDHDGQVDNVPGAGDPCTVGQGECMISGTQECAAGHLACNAAPHEPSLEICDGLDNDCDGVADNGLGLGAACDVGVGACLQHGTQVCGDNGAVLCSATAGNPTPEICNNIDDDCDGIIDNLVEVCHQGVGACESAGVRVCTPQGQECNAPPPGNPRAEIVNGQDDDCDGLTDEIIPHRIPVPAGNVVDRFGATQAVPAFWMAETETTVEQYAQCVLAGRCPAPPQGAGYMWGLPNHERYPVNGIQLAQAQAFCTWAGGTLPTDLQFIRAARGDAPATFLYPWGDGPLDCEHAQISDCNPMQIVSVGLHPIGISVFGVYDLAGNLIEWSDTVAPGVNKHYVFGGAYNNGTGVANGEIFIQIDHPFAAPNAFAGPSTEYGVRCAFLAAQ